MSHELHSSYHELSRPYNAWEKFTLRDEKKHRAEDELNFRLCNPQNQPTEDTATVIRLFLTHGSHRLHDPVPRQQQLLKDFLSAADPSFPALSATTYLEDVQGCSKEDEIALLDDRNKHGDCARFIGQTCGACYNFSQNVTIPELCARLRDRVSNTSKILTRFKTDLVPYLQRKKLFANVDRRIL